MHAPCHRVRVLLAVVCGCSLWLWACSLPQRSVPPPELLPITANGSQLYGKIADLRGQRFIAFEALPSMLATAQVITFGEEHYHPDILAFVLRLFTALAEQRSRPLVLALEFLERDMQPDIAAYLQGHIGEVALQHQLKTSAAFMRLYFPLIRTARQHSLAVLAPNVPRYLARRVAKEGLQSTLASLNEDELRYMPALPTLVTPHYRAYFLEAIATVHTLQAAEVESFVEAAYLKDDTMAESLVLFLDQAPNATIFLLAGRFHTDYGMAIPALLQERRPHMRLQKLTAMPLAATDTVNLRQLAQENLADYVWFTPPAAPPAS